jgi:hypothetical protein
MERRHRSSRCRDGATQAETTGRMKFFVDIAALAEIHNVVAASLDRGTTAE